MGEKKSYLEVPGLVIFPDFSLQAWLQVYKWAGLDWSEHSNPLLIGEQHNPSRL